MILRRFNVHSQGFRITVADNGKPLAVCLSTMLYKMHREIRTSTQPLPDQETEHGQHPAAPHAHALLLPH